MTDYPRPLLDTPLWTDGPTPLDVDREYHRELSARLDEVQREAAMRGTCPGTGLPANDPAQCAMTHEHHLAIHQRFLAGQQWRVWIPRVWWRPSTWFSPKFGRWSTAEEMDEIERRVTQHIDDHRP